MFKIALIGRTNVGKSTLFNRLSKSREALMFDRPGVTRDTKESIIDIYGKKCLLIDTPGMFDYDECDNNPLLMKAIEEKLDEVIKAADAILFIIDGTCGITGYDKEIAGILRKRGKTNIIFIINKSEKKSSKNSLIEALEFGFDHNIPISAEHGEGVSDLLETLYKIIPEKYIFEENDSDKKDIIKLAIIGRPNVGKSTIVNTILGENKRLVADMAGLTRETSESDFVFKGRNIKIIDTPGVRRKSRITDHLEKISVASTKRAYKNADIVILIIDGSGLISGELEKQDMTLASHIVREGKALVIAFNKVDLTPYNIEDKPKFLQKEIGMNLSQLKDVPFLFVCGTDGANIEKMLFEALKAYDKQSKKIKTSELNDWLYEINNSDLLQSGSAKFKLKYVTQVGKIPPKFLVFGTNIKNMRESHERYITSNLKQKFALKEVPIQVFFREQKKK